MTTTPYPVPDIAEEPLGSVARILSLGAGDGTDVFTGGSLPQLSGRVYGGQSAVEAGRFPEVAHHAGALEVG